MKTSPKMVRTLKVELHIDPRRKDEVLETMKQFNQAFDIHSAWSVSNRNYDGQAAHNELYFKTREQLPNLPCGFVQKARDAALASLKTQVKKNHGWVNVTPKRKKDCLLFDCRTFTLRGQQMTLSTVDKRLKVIVPRPPKFFKDVWDTWDCKGGSLLHRRGHFFFCFTFTKEAPKRLEVKNVLGIDRGIKNIVATSDGTVVSGKKLNGVRRKRLYQKRGLQAKGTRSAKRLFQALSGKEKRFSLQQANVVVNSLLAKDYDTYVLEDLTNIRERCKGDKEKNKHMSDWTFSVLQFVLEYKCQALGKRVVYVSPAYTSQECHKCGHVEAANRRGSKFLCKKCGNRDHADLNAAKNIRDRYLLASVGKTGCAMNQPNAPRTS
jgi:putative transposase